MCGIAGVISSGVAISSEIIQRALESISHRGPDNLDYKLQSNVVLGHVRLSILDLSEAGNQPMTTDDGRYTIAFNGEVYNFKDLASDHGINDLKSNSDTEVVLRLFEKLGAESLGLLNGMFALAVYDNVLGKVWVARDRLGIKPLYYSCSEEGIYFGSEMKSIFELTGNQKKISDESVHEWSYYGNTLGTKTLYDSVLKLLPGHFIEINVSDLSIEQTSYWQPDDYSPIARSRIPTERDLNSRVRVCLETAVKRQLVSDVPVGVFLSGGIDSSAITAFASKHYQGKLATYSVGFDFDNGNNELPLAKEIATRYGTDHHELHVSGFDVADIVEKMIHHHDAPFSDAANIPLYLLCEKVKDTTKVVLQGDGGDELFGGYQRYKTLSHIRGMQFVARVGGMVNRFLPKNAGYYARQRYINALLASSDAEIMALLLTVEDRQFPPSQIFSTRFRERVESFDPFVRYKECESKFSDQDLANRMLMVDSMIILPDIFFEKVDRSTMASSVEVRVPFLDNDLVDLCFSLPADVKVKNGVQKWLLKKSLEGIVPDNVLYGKKKGFGVPFGYWVKGPLKELLFDNVELFTQSNSDILDKKFIQQTFDDMQNGRRDASFLMWKLLNFVIWANKNKVNFG